MTKGISKLRDECYFTGQLEKDAYDFLVDQGYPEIAEHSRQVAEIAQALAQRFDLDPVAAKIAGYLHDLGRVIPKGEMVSLAEEWGIVILPEEKSYPEILHSKLSKVLAVHLFGVTDQAVLDALECHTTLKRGASALECLLFVADKLSWEPEQYQGVIDGIERGLEFSLEQGALAYLQYLWGRKAELKVIHPWVLEAYQDLHKV